MDSEAEIVIAFLFKRSGKEELSLSEFYLPLSMDLKWFSPKQAKAFVSHAVEQKLLIKKGDLVKPNFGYKKVVVPIGFQPSKQIFEEKKEDIKEEKEDVMKTIISRIVKKTCLDAQSVAEKIKSIEKEKNITSEIAALLVGKEYDASVEDCFGDVEDKIFRENRE